MAEERVRDRAAGIISGGRLKQLADAGLVVVESETLHRLLDAMGEHLREDERARAPHVAELRRTRVRLALRTFMERHREEP